MNNGHNVSYWKRVVNLQTLLKQQRLKKGYRQEDVARLLNISTRQYQRIESGKSFLTQEKLNKLEDLFQTPQRVLLAKNVEEIPSYYHDFLYSTGTEDY